MSHFSDLYKCKQKTRIQRTCFLCGYILRTGKYPFYETELRKREGDREKYIQVTKKKQEGAHMLYNKRLKQMVRM